MNRSAETLLPVESVNSIRQSIRGGLVGEAATFKRREELRRISEFQLQKTDLIALSNLGLTLDLDAVNSVSPEEQQLIREHLGNLTATILQTSEDQLTEVRQAVQDVISNPSSEVLLRFPENSLVYRVAGIILALILSLSMNVLLSKDTKAQMPTVTPTPSETVIKKTPVVPTVTPKSLLPTATPSPTIEVTPEITATPEVLVDYAVISVDIANLRSNPSLTGEIVTTAIKDERFAFTGKKSPVANPEWFEVYLTFDPVKDPAENKTRTAWLHKSVFVVEQFPETSSGKGGAVEPVEIESSQVTTTVPITESTQITNSSEILENQSSDPKEIYGSDVEIDSTGAYPIAKINDFVVGEYKDGAWQQIREIIILSEKELAYYPNIEEKTIDNKTVLVQTTLGDEVVIAEKNQEGKWQQPTFTSLELARRAEELDIKSIEYSSTKGAVTSGSPAEYGYHITEFPGIEMINGQPSNENVMKDILVRGIALESIQVVHLPILKEVNGAQVETGWSIRFLVLPIASVDDEGNWHTNNLIVGATQELVNPNNEVFGHSFAPDGPPDIDVITYSELDSNFAETSTYSQNFPLTKASEVTTDIERGTPLAVVVYGATQGDPDVLEENRQYVEGLRNGFLLQEGINPSSDQTFAVAIELVYEILNGYSIAEYGMLSDQEIYDMIHSQQYPAHFWGGASAVHPIKNN